MAGLRTAFDVVASTIRFLSAGIQYVRRRRQTDAHRPKLPLNFIHAPYWGTEKLDIAISNMGGGR